MAVRSLFSWRHAVHIVLLGALFELAGIVVLVVQYERVTAPASPEAAGNLELTPRGGIFTLKRA